MTALLSTVQTVVVQQPEHSWLAAAGYILTDSGFWMLAAVPIVLALFGLRVTRGRLPRGRVLYGVSAAVLWSGFQTSQLLRAFDVLHGATMRTATFTFFLAIFPVFVAGSAGLSIGSWRRLALRVALPLTVFAAMIATATGWTAAFSIIEMVNAAG